MKELSLQNNSGNSIKPTRLFHFWLVACVVFYLIGAKEIVWNFWNLHIFSPVVAAFAGRGLVILGTLKTSRPLVLVMIVSIIVVIVFSGRNTLRNVYSSEHYSNDYRMGMALRELKKPGNLVVVIGHEVGNPIAIFYSRCHGWAFRPTETKGWEKLPTNDKENIHTLGELRLKGADWLGIVDGQYRDIETHHPVLVSHISANYKLEVQTKDFVIFRMNE